MGERIKRMFFRFQIPIKSVLMVSVISLFSYTIPLGGSSRIEYFPGNVGIGTQNPSVSLDIVGSVKVSGGVSSNGTISANKFAGDGSGLFNVPIAVGVVTDNYTGNVTINGGVSVNGILSANTIVGTHLGTWSGNVIGLGYMNTAVVTNNYTGNVTINGGVSVNGILSADTIVGTHLGTWSGNVIGLGYMNTAVVTNNYNGSVSINGTISANKLVAYGPVVFSQSGTYTVPDAASTLPSNMSFLKLAGTGALDMTSAPQIAAGVEGQQLIILGTSDTNTVKLHNDANLVLFGGASFTLGNNDVLRLVYSGTAWYEMGRSDN